MQILIDEQTKMRAQELAPPAPDLVSPQFTELFLPSMLPRFVQNSAAFEGITADEHQIRDLLAGGFVPSVELSRRVQLCGYRDAFHQMLEHVISGKDMTIEDEKLYHFISTPMGDERRGEFRDGQIHVAIRTHVPPEADELDEAMTCLLDSYRASDLHPILKAAWFHLDHERIHPFHFANGRVERLLVNRILMEHGYLPICVRFEDIKEYIGYFDTYYETGDITPMADYFLKLEIEAIETYQQLG